jgi:hypothetical protein
MLSNLNEKVKFDLTQSFEKWNLFHNKKTGVN